MPMAPPPPQFEIQNTVRVHAEQYICMHVNHTENTRFAGDGSLQRLGEPNVGATGLVSNSCSVNGFQRMRPSVLQLLMYSEFQAITSTQARLSNAAPLVVDLTSCVCAEQLSSTSWLAEEIILLTLCKVSWLELSKAG